MKKSTLVLKNAASYEIEEASSLAAVVIVSESKEAMKEVWDSMTEENLAEVKILNGEGLAVGSYENLILVSETSVVSEDGSVKTSFCLREKTDMELRMDDLEESQEAQDAAIEDIAAAM
jgi:predicted transcriptional regulator